MGETNTLSKTSAIRAKLVACEERITKLEADLAAERSLRDELLIELQSSTMTSSISALPTEILMQIFEAVVEDDSPAISGILLTCRKWNQIAMEHSKIWAVLSFCLPSTGILMYLGAATNYVGKALEKSGTHLLDIHLDFRSMIDFDTMTFEAASALFPESVAVVVRHGWQPHNAAIKGELCIIAEATMVLYIQFVGALMDDGATASRLRSFTFKTSSTLAYDPAEKSYNICEYMFTRFAMPALERVDLLDYHDELLESCPRAKHLLLRSRLLFESDPDSLEVLETLHMFMDSPLASLDAAIRLCHLSVEFSLENIEWIRDDPAQYISHMSLGALETLSLHGKHAHILLSHLETPKLRVLRLVGGDAIWGASEAEASVWRPSVYVHVLAAECHAPAVNSLFEAWLLEQVDAAGVVVMPWHADTATEWLKSRSRRGLVGMTVQTLDWTSEYESVERLEEELWRVEEKDLRCRIHTTR